MQNAYPLEKVEEIVNNIFDENLHEKRKQSISYAAIGLLASGSLFLHEMGTGMARARDVNKKHATKQIDRLLSNRGVDLWELSADWVPYVIGQQTELNVALDWTSFANDEQWTLCLNVLTGQGCATPLLWKTVEKAHLKYNRGRYEDQLLTRLKDVLPKGVKVTLVADRGFAAYRFFDFIENKLGFDYIIRIKSNTLITDKHSKTQAARRWLRQDNRARAMKDIAITKEHFPIKQFVCVKDKGMKDTWYLVTNKSDMKTRQIINLYAKRWKIEPYFRDIKDGRYGYGLRRTHIKNGERRDRLLLIVALCYMLLLLMGQTGEQLGFDSLLKVNTVKTRTHSLFRQGQFYLQFFHHWPYEKQQLFLEKFALLLEQRGFWLAFFHKKI